ncbi:MAG: AMP phosphorylase [Candidatus Bathyarchaeia archaeon]
MRLKSRLIHLDAGGKWIAILNDHDAEELGVRSLSRIRIRKDEYELTAIVNTTSRVVAKGAIGVYDEAQARLRLQEGDEVEVEPSSPPNSINHIKNRLRGRKLSREETYEIIKDLVSGQLSEVEVTAFVTSLHHFALDIDEATNLSLAMVETGNTLDLGDKLIVDKHSIGGVPGDKTTLLVVPIVAACGLTIPKSSSRAITSAAGTADRAEVLMPVDLDVDEMRHVLQETGGCIVWGGALHLAPADEIFVQVEFPLSIDPLLLPSIISKKKAVGANFVVVDIPTGAETKVKTLSEAQLLAQDFIDLGRRLKMSIQCAITYGGQPIGQAIGPALEAREALENLMGLRQDQDLIDKATDIAGMLLEMTGRNEGKATAMEILRTGRAEQKLREIIRAQGGDPEVRPEDISIGDYRLEKRADKQGVVLWVDISKLVDQARLAGAPKDKGAGILLHRKLGEKVGRGDPLYTIFAEKAGKLEDACSAAGEEAAVIVGERMEMTLSQIKELRPPRERFVLER